MKKEKRFKRTLFQQLYFYMLPRPRMRLKYLKKHNVFAELGERCFYQCRRIPADPYLVKIHNNVAIAADVLVVTHDVIHMMANKMDDAQERGKLPARLGCVEIMDNCFLGSGCIILPNVRIGPNAVVAAGAVVTKDVPENSVVAGNPARVVGTLDALLEKRKEDVGKSTDAYSRRDELWEAFERQRQETSSDV